MNFLHWWMRKPSDTVPVHGLAPVDAEASSPDFNAPEALRAPETVVDTEAPAESPEAGVPTGFGVVDPTDSTPLDANSAPAEVADDELAQASWWDRAFIANRPDPAFPAGAPTRTNLQPADISETATDHADPP